MVLMDLGNVTDGSVPGVPKMAPMMVRRSRAGVHINKLSNPGITAWWEKQKSSRVRWWNLDMAR